MSDEKRSRRSEMAYRECTRDPIFMLQRKVHHVDWAKARDHNLTNPEGEGLVWPNGKPASDDTLERIEVFVPYWETPSRVFYSREEAEKYAEDRSYDWGRKNKDWRVWCGCAEGELAKVLDAFDAMEQHAREIAETSMSVAPA